MLTTDNCHVLAFLRRTDEELVLVLDNLSRLAQPVKVQLNDYTGFTPIELFGRVTFPQINAASTNWMLPPYGFYWFQLSSPKSPGKQPLELPAVRVSTINSVLNWDHRGILGEILLEYLRKQSHARASSMTYAEVIDIVKFGSMSALIVIRLSFTAGDPELQLLPLNIAVTQKHDPVADSAGAVLTALLTETGDRGVLYTGHNAGAIGNGLLQLIATETSVVTHTGSLQGQAASVVAPSLEAERVCLIPSAGREFEQRNASVRMSERFVIKLFRHLEAGPHPDFELPRFLHDHAGFCNVAPPIGTVYYVSGESEPITAAVLYSYIDSRHDLWQLTIDELFLFLDRTCIRSGGAMTGSHNGDDNVGDLLERYLERMRILGRRSAEMHLALGGATDWPDFAPEVFDPFFARGEIHAMNEMVRRLLIEFEATLPAVPPDCRSLFRTLSEQASNLRSIFERLVSVQSLGHRIRIHGDFHLGQVLETRGDVVFIDFEGDSTQPLARRVIKRSPLVDVAGMEFSLQYAVAASTRPERWDRTKHAECARSWSLLARASFRDEYLRTMNGSNLLPRAANDFKTCLAVYLVAKAVYQVAYELENRRGWIPVAVQTLLDLIAETSHLDTMPAQTSQ